MAKQKFISLFVLCCLLPLAAAWLVLTSGWYQGGVNSKGQWLAAEIRLLPAVPATAPHWRLVFVAPASCQQYCAQTLQLMTQIHTALGRKQQQLSLLVVAAELPSGLAAGLPKGVQFQQSDVTGLQIGSLVLVEQQGLALLQYPLPMQPQQFPLTGKAVMADLKKLMNYDRGPV